MPTLFNETALLNFASQDNLNQNLDQNEYQYPLDSHSTSVDTENKQCIGESSIQDVVKEMSESQNLLTEIKKEVFQDDYKIKTEGKIK